MEEKTLRSMVAEPSGDPILDAILSSDLHHLEQHPDADCRTTWRPDALRLQSSQATPSLAAVRKTAECPRAGLPGDELRTLLTAGGTDARRCGAPALGRPPRPLCAFEMGSRKAFATSGSSNRAGGEYHSSPPCLWGGGAW